MKIHSLLLAVAFAAFLPSRAFTQYLNPTQPPLISVSGSSEVKLPPDEIDLRVGVETHSEKLEDAKKDNDDRIANALGFLKKNGVPPKDVQTDYISIEPDYNYSRPTPIIYVVRKSIEIKLTQIDTFEATLTGLLINGVNTVHGVEFRTTELRKYRDEARAMAIRAAREKADALAAELGVKRGKVYSINANEWGGLWSSSGSYWGGRSGGASQNSVQNLGGAAETGDGTMSIGQVSVSATVNVSFLIE